MKIPLDITDDLGAALGSSTTGTIPTSQTGGATTGSTLSSSSGDQVGNQTPTLQSEENID